VKGRVLIFAFLIALLGILLSLFPFTFKLEEGWGLNLLFKLRGQRNPPPDVVVISMDRESILNLNLPDKYELWPHSLHVRLIENLIKAGAQIIIFDISFTESRSIDENNLFADKIRMANNVVLCMCLKHEKIPFNDKRGSPKGDVEVVSVEPPIPPLSQSAVAIAPFPLPKVPFRLSQYWMFKTAAGDMPTLPVVAFQVFTMQVYDEFIDLLKKVNPDRAGNLPHDSKVIIEARMVEEVVREIRDIFQSETKTGERMLEELRKSNIQSTDMKKYQLITSLIRMYQSTDSRYLNFYGPPRTIPTIDYYQALHLQERSFYKKNFDLKGKAVFIGISLLTPTEQKEGFYTVFSQPQGLDVSGVEIAATAFANLVEDMPVRPIDFHTHLLIIALWGLSLGFICRRFHYGIAALCVVGASILYLIAVVYQFKTKGSWYPLVIPLLYQGPIALFSAVVWNYIDSIKERQTIRRAFEYYLPKDVVDQLSKNIADIKATRQLVYGICLYTDAEQYTHLSEVMDPKELGNFMDAYCETVFKPIKQYGGVVSNVVGDSVLALWVSEHPEIALRRKACFAALDIASSIEEFNRTTRTFHLPIRISIHSGHILLGHIGAIDRFEYRPIGEMINTAVRVDGLNKYLGSRILVSEGVINQLDGFLTREMGKFMLVGKTIPIVVYELISRMEESTEQQKRVCGIFAEALDAFRRKSWDEAIQKFNGSDNMSGGDRPSLFYINLCNQLKENPPEESWDGVVHMDKK